MIGFWGTVGFLITAGIIGLWFQVRRARTVLAEAFDIAWSAPDPADDAALIRQVEIDHFEHLFFEVPDTEGVVWPS